MSNLTISEKLQLEKLLEMESGYVLDFVNRTFQDFVLDAVGVDIFDEKYNYRSGSKANRLRGFWKEEENALVGQLISKLLDYWYAIKLTGESEITVKENRLFEECKKTSNRLRGHSNSTSAQPNQKSASLHLEREALLSEFDGLASLSGAQASRQRGYRLEELLNKIFTFHKIQTQKSFKRNEGGEQIDGAFKLEGWYYLVECKWTQKLTDIRQLDSLYGKIGCSGKQTLGLFLSING